MRSTRRWTAAAALTTLTLFTAHVYGACAFGTSNEMSLQGVFDSVLVPGSLSAANDCIPSAADGLWTAEGQAAATIVIELSKYAGKNILGIYDPLNPQSQVSIFPGAASSGATTTLELVSDGAGYDVMANDAVAGHFASSAFGFFIRTPRNRTFFSEPTLNTDQADHMYAYRGNGDLFTGGPLAGTLFATSMYLLAFENLRIPLGGPDFQDFVATVNFVAPIPLPAGAWLLGGLLASLALWHRRAVVASTSN